MADQVVPVTDPLLDAPDGAVVVFPNGITYERHGSEWVALHLLCEGLTASWCPVHGNCTCPRQEDGEIEFDKGEQSCPLHSLKSHHASQYAAPAALCTARSDDRPLGLYCVLPDGHEGAHIATDTAHRVIRSWGVQPSAAKDGS